MTESAIPLSITPIDSGFAVTGEIDAHTAPTVAAAIASSPVSDLVVDLSAVDFVDSSGLRVLIEAHQNREAMGGTLTLSQPSAVVSRLFDISGVRGYLRIVDAPT